MAKMTAEDIAWLESWRSILIASPSAASVYAFQDKLLHSQSQSAKSISRLTIKQAVGVLAHAMRDVPFYSSYARQVPLSEFKKHPERAWTRLPILTRHDLQDSGNALSSRLLPPGHVRTGKLRSSGSTGTPVEVATTNIVNMWQKAFALRAAVWARRDFSQTLAVIRKFADDLTHHPDGQTSSHWADPEGIPFKTGQRFSVDATSRSIDDQLSWLLQRQPAYLMTYPSILRELIAALSKASSGWQPLGITTLGETVDDELREDVLQYWNLSIDDVYSAEECGTIAVQCPSHGRYHIQSEALMVEIVDEQGRLCPAGKEGRVVVTTLANYAMPLIRYWIGDWAIAGAACGCGRNLPVLTKVLGRERNLLVTRQGKFWPSFGTRKLRDLAPISAQMFRQHSLDKVKMYYVSPTPLTDEQSQAVQKHLAQSLPANISLEMQRVDELDRARTGKREVFASDVGSKRDAVQ